MPPKKRKTTANNAKNVAVSAADKQPPTSPISRTNVSETADDRIGIGDEPATTSITFVGTHRASLWTQLMSDAEALCVDGRVLAFPHEPDLWLVADDSYRVHQVQCLDPARSYWCACDEFVLGWQGTVCAHTMAVAMLLHMDAALVNALAVVFASKGLSVAESAVDDATTSGTVPIAARPTVKDETSAASQSAMPAECDWETRAIQAAGYSSRQLWIHTVSSAQSLCAGVQRVEPVDDLYLVDDVMAQRSFTVEQQPDDSGTLFSCTCKPFKRNRRLCAHTLAVALSTGHVPDYRAQLLQRCTQRPSHHDGEEVGDHRVH